MKTGVSAFGHQLKSWRSMRKVSQLDLALNAAVSQRHVSWLETGKSRPSREMVIQLAEALDIPLRARNTLLGSAGFAAVYSEASFDSDAMAPVQNALRAMLAHHDPLPAFVLDRLWRIEMANDSAENMLRMFGDIEALWKIVDPSGRRSLARLTLHPEGARPFIANWRELAGGFLHRLRREALASGDDEEREEFESLLGLVGNDELVLPASEPNLLPVLPLILDYGELHLSLFSVIATFGTPQDITVDELRIESFFPADEATKAFFDAASLHKAQASK